MNDNNNWKLDEYWLCHRVDIAFSIHTKLFIIHQRGGGVCVINSNYPLLKKEKKKKELLQMIAALANEIRMELSSILLKTIFQMEWIVKSKENDP